MAKRFWTADLHLGHHNIITYCARPFKDAEHMNTRLIANINSRVKAEDTLIHVGDFANYGKARGEEGLRINPKNYVNDINGTFVNIRGNHDDNNRTKSVCDFMIVMLGKMQLSVAHKPSWQISNIDFKSLNVVAHICGHVHEKFTYAYSDDKLLNVNIGCDVWNYYPINDSELVEYINKIKKTG